MKFRRLYRRTIAASIAVAVLSVPSSALFYVRLQEEKAVAEELTLVRQEIELADELLTQLLNLETGMRGYANTGDRRFLDPYWQGKRQVPVALARLEKLHPNFKGLREKVLRVLMLSDMAIQQGTTQAKMETGKAVMDEIRELLDTFKSDSQLIRDRILRQREARERRDLLLGILSGFITLLLLWLVYQSATNMKAAFTKAEESLELEEKLRRKAEESLELKEMLRAAEELARAEAEKVLEKERELSQAKSLIIQTISHEYRTPLTAILTAAELLGVVDPASAKRKKYIDQIRGGVNRLVSMTEDVLTLFRFDASVMSIEERTIYLQHWFESLIESFEGSDRVILDIQVDQIDCDEGLLYKIFSNLVGNALKYSSSSVLVSVVKEGGNIRFSVKDSGIGIPHSIRMFEPFERGSNVGTVQGTGLGLSIVKKAVELLGGTIEVSSTEGKGSEFVVRLPNS